MNSIRYRAFAALLILGSLRAAPAQAQHLGDVQIRLVDQQLATANSGGDDRIFVNEFDDFGGTLFTDDPGFESQTGALPGGLPIGFNVTQSLMYWDGFAIRNADGAASLKLSLGPANPVFVTHDSGVQPGFTFATSSSSGTIHAHPSYTLAPRDVPFGLYGVVLELTSPGYETSLPFLIAFNFGLADLAQINAGMAAMALAAGINGVPGDTDHDGDVDLADLNNVRNHFGASGTSVLGDTLPFDGTVDLEDLNNVRNHFGARQAVPEPNTATLFVVASFSLFIAQRHRTSPKQPPLVSRQGTGGR
jgi:hypothetical protein